MERDVDEDVEWIAEDAVEKRDVNADEVEEIAERDVDEDSIEA